MVSLSVAFKKNSRRSQCAVLTDILLDVCDSQTGAGCTVAVQLTGFDVVLAELEQCIYPETRM